MSAVTTIVLLVLCAVCIASLIYLIYRGRTQYARYSQSPHPFHKPHTTDRTKIAILFTMYNRSDERKRMAEDVIRWYTSMRQDGKSVVEDFDMSAQSVDIFTVDSANRGVNHDLVPLRNQAIFEQDDKCKVKSRDSTELELCSLRYAASVLDFSGYEYVVKLTTKYKLDPFILPVGFDIVVQSQHVDKPANNSKFEGWQNSELFALKATRFEEFVRRLSTEYEAALEHRLWMLSHSDDVRFTRLPKLRNHAKYANAMGYNLQVL